MTDRQAEKLIKLAKELSEIIYKYERLFKPSEADKARQVNKLLKQIEQRKQNSYGHIR